MVPELCGPDRLPLLLRLAIEEEYVCLDALGMKEAVRETQQGVNLTLLEEVLAHGLPR